MLDLATLGRLQRPVEGVQGKTAPDLGMLPALLSISKATRAFYGLRLAALGFHNGQDELLIAIGDEAIPVSVMADQLSVRPSTVSKMLDRLIEKGLCERTSDKRDARRTLVQITPAGVEVRKQLVRLRQDVEADLARHLDADACKVMTQALTDCADNLTRQLRRVR